MEVIDVQGNWGKSAVGRGNLSRKYIRRYGKRGDKRRLEIIVGPINLSANILDFDQAEQQLTHFVVKP